MTIQKFLLSLLFFVYLVQCQRGFHVKIENLSGGALVPTPFSDIVWAIHTGASPLFRPGRYATTGLRRLAEDGYGQILAAEAQNSTGAVAVGVRNGPVPVGATVEFGITASPGQRFSFATMYVKSNDAFFASNPGGVALFDESGDAVSGTYETILYDAGTEVSEAPGQGINQAPAQPQAQVGQVENIPVSRVSLARTNFSDPSIVIRFTITAATTFRVRVENIGNGTGFSPIVWAVGLTPGLFFTAGEKASQAIQNIAEDGNGRTLANQIAAQTSVLFSGIVGAGPIVPGKFVEWTVPATPGTMFYLASMYGWSNDRFFSTPPQGVSLFTSAGPYSSPNANFVQLWDAGTAMNEQPGQGKFQASARKGVPRDSTVWPDETNVVKEAFLGAPDGFTYQTVASTFKLSIAAVTDAPGFLASNPNQNVYVNFKFSNMFKFSS
eukprot:TRINITY_DN1191_c0_g1_i6.p1 TRINITY_DN1191_c0_g1~~TRINITY_DN1191_c0_g1_i6.p1  ORF type:complete len:439 (-),score=140.11 TRINITY_DN1191_c0_g1_i6:98-1414(-)